MNGSGETANCADAPRPLGKLVRTDHWLIAGVFILMIAGLLAVANLGMDVLTSMRAYVAGEGFWSKAQKDAVHYLLRYGKTHAEEDYQRYERAIAVPLADHDARSAMEQRELDRQRAARSFVRGRNHPDDVNGMINLFRRYHFEPHIQRAIQAWTEADGYLQRLHQLGTMVRQELTKPTPDLQYVDRLLAEVDSTNERFPEFEDAFSQSLGDAARYARFVVFVVLAAVALLALLLGLSVSYRLLLRAREADERYRHLFETASDALIICEHDTGLILNANPKLSELTGIPVETLVGTRQSELFGREIPAVPGVSLLQSGDLVIRHVGGASIPVDVRTNSARYRNRSVDYSIVRDIRERRRFEEKMHESARMDSLGRLAGGIAHDFNNLLTVIVGYAQLLQRITEGEAHERADQIEDTAKRAATLTRQLLAFGRKQPLQPQSLDLNQVLSGMTDMIRSVLDEQIELELDLRQGLHRIEADPHQVEQIVLNLCTNARDAMPEGGRLMIRTWNVLSVSAAAASEKELVGFAVTDTGHGMDDATQTRIFEPFFTTKPQGKGTGLGLATVFGTVQQSGGQISVESKPGRGTTFTILLPRSTRSYQTGAETPLLEETAGTETLLLVEDDAAVRETLAYGLRQEGYEVYPAANGWEAFDFFNTAPEKIALIITDLVMPEMGGIVLGEHLRDTGSSIPILYVTGYHQDLEKYSPAQLPLFGGFLLKPFSAQALARAVRNALRNASSGASENCA